jgi:hypothetical protein
MQYMWQRHQHGITYQGCYTAESYQHREGVGEFFLSLVILSNPPEYTHVTVSFRAGLAGKEPNHQHNLHVFLAVNMHEYWICAYVYHVCSL